VASAPGRPRHCHRRAGANVLRPVYVRRAIVHNSHVVARLAAAGATFVQTGRGAEGSGRGAERARRCHCSASLGRRARPPDRGRDCPMWLGSTGSEAFTFVGLRRAPDRARGHDEVVGTLGRCRNATRRQRADAAALRVADPERVGCVTQTTLSRKTSRLSSSNCDDVSQISAARREISVSRRATPVGGYLAGKERRRCAGAGRPHELQFAASARVAVDGHTAYLIESLADLRDEWLRTARLWPVSRCLDARDLVSDVADHLCAGGAVFSGSVRRRACLLQPAARARAAARAER